MLLVNRSFIVLLTLSVIFQGCGPPSVDPDPSLSEQIKVKLSTDGNTLTVVHYGKYNEANKQLVDLSLKELQNNYVLKAIQIDVYDDSLVSMIKTQISNKDVYSKIHDLSFYKDSVVVVYTLDIALIHSMIDPLIATYGHAEKKVIFPLFTSENAPPDVSDITDLKLQYPCTNGSIPSRALLLPNAPRTYRNGIHRGIDFVVNWGSLVHAVADGIVIRSDLHYEEFNPEFRKQLLDDSATLGHTPSDVFNHVLLGRSVFIDHGFDLVPGYRAVSIYAHLSHIDSHIRSGATIDAGERIGLSGNSGTEDGTLGKRTGAHLHWELILQDAGGEYYLGQGWSYDEMITSFRNIFSE